MFEVRERIVETPALAMRYHLTPWDEPTVGAPVAAISGIDVHDVERAADDFREFRDWCTGNGVVLASCRVPHERLVECGFLESQGFRFIELNYRPELSGLRRADLEAADEFVVETATTVDADPIADMAGKIFEAGRFHADPMIASRVGNLRYRRWVENAFGNSAQSVLKCGREGRIEAFFVVEAPRRDHRFWSLVGLAPGLGGHGLGTRVWRAVLGWHRREGVDHVATSISSLNAAVLNLYVKLGFRFPPPSITLHWCPGGFVTGPA
jgi:GNAT superfamily N-acetyltransferase